MINKRLISLVPESKKHIIINVISQIITLVLSTIIIYSMGRFIEIVYENTLSSKEALKQQTILIIIIGVSIIIRSIMIYIASKASFNASKTVKYKLRKMIYDKLLLLGGGYINKTKTSNVVQTTIEGVEQIESYFGAYLPQFFYSNIAPILLFTFLSFISFKTAIILFLCVPLIPISIILIQKFAKKILAKYWGKYLALGSSFLENLQGLTTLKIYQADEYKHQKMDEEAEEFRKVTMKVLTMQLNSITIMDIVAYSGAALGVILSAIEFKNGNIGLLETFLIIMLSAEFFLPLRKLGSYFHVAMNGLAAGKKIFKLIDIEVSEKGKEDIDGVDIKIKDLSFAYEENIDVLKNINLNIKQNDFVSIVGESGCGKSTIAKIIMGINEGYRGNMILGSKEIKDIKREDIMENITLVGMNSYIFKGDIRTNMLMGNENASDEDIWNALEEANLSEFIRSEQGLDTKVLEQGSNLSGGQKQRLAIARGLLHNSSTYIFDEATSNIDSESENIIMDLLRGYKNKKTIILITHRLANAIDSDKIFVLDDGKLIEKGSHQELINNNNVYSKLWSTQEKLEKIRGGFNNEK